MADNVVVARYELNTGQFDAKVDEVVQGYEDMDKASKGATDAASKSTNALSGSVGNLSNKLAVVTEEEKRAAKGAKDLAGETKKAADESKKAGTAIDQFKGGVSQLGGALGGTLNSFKTFVTGILSGAKAIGAAITTALGPVGIAIAAVVATLGLLAKAFFGTVEGGDKLRKVTEPLKAIFQTLIGVAQQLGKIIVDTFSNPQQAVEDLWEAIKTNIVNRIKGVGDTFISLGKLIDSALRLDFEGVKENAVAFGESVTQSLTGVDDLAGKAAAGFNSLSKTIGAAADRGSRLAEITKRIAELRIEQAKSQGALERQFQEELEIANDITKTGQEREAAAERAIAARKQITALQSGILKLEIEQLELNAANNDTSREELLIIEQKKAELNTVIADELRETRRVKKLVNNLRKQENAEIASAAKAQADENRKLSEARIGIEAKVSDALNGLAEERLARTQTDVEREVKAAEKKYEDLEKVAREGFKQIRDLSPPGEEAAIAQKEADVLAQITAAKNQELLALQVEQDAALAATREEALEGIRQSLLTDTELQREAVLQQLDEQVAAAEKFITNEEERNAVIAELTKNAEAELTGIITDEEAKRREAQEESARKQAELAQQNAALVTSFAEQGLATVISAAAQGKDIQEEAGKQLIGLLLDTLEKIILMNAINAQTGAIAFGFSTGNPIAGIAAGIAVAAVIKGLFGALKSQITANYEGDPYVGGDGSRPTWSGRDGFLRRLDKGERVVTRRTNEEHFPALEAMEGGRFDDWVMANYLPRFESINDDDRMVQYVNSDMGQRMAQSITLPRMFDKNIVESSQAARKEQQRTNELLAAMLQQGRPRRRNTRYN